MTINICVVGAGIIGLSTAYNIIEKVKQIDSRIVVDLVADTFSPHTTSDGSAGLWEPYQFDSASPEKIKQWGESTLRFMLELSKSPIASEVGAFEISGCSLFKNKPQEFPVWTDIVIGFQAMTERELEPYPDYKYGYKFTTAVLESIKYLPWLKKRFVEKGGKIFKQKINSIEELFPAYSIVVNCTGMGAREVADDLSMQPILGQVTRVKAPWIKKFLFADEDVLYVIPTSNTVTLGGTFDKGNWDTKIDYKQRNRILEGCERLVPSLKGAEHVSDWAGLRPYRPNVRVERSFVSLPQGKHHVVHNYGHAGGGITFHWGCAVEATKLVLDALQEIKGNSKL